jgi:F0F1-type ATP synthase delta subunit
LFKLEHIKSPRIHPRSLQTRRKFLKLIQTNIGFVKFLRLYKQYKEKKRLKILWKIAEYYMKKKYHPNNILKYLDLE